MCQHINLLGIDLAVLYPAKLFGMWVATALSDAMHLPRWCLARFMALSLPDVHLASCMAYVI